MNAITIAIDAMGGDHGPSVIIPASLQILEKFAHLNLILVGDKDLLQKKLYEVAPSYSQRIILHHASQHVEMNEPPSQALRSKKDSSMRVAINLVKEGQANACVSAGNTGALMATARFVLKTIPGIDRPAIISTFPTILGNSMRMLDLGANVDSTAAHLFQFAVMGSVLAREIDNIKNPRVSLLNIGVEDIKGNELVKTTAKWLEKTAAINYIGFIEGDSLYSGNTDIVVCDGFVGNVALKTSEGVAILIAKIIKKEFQQNWLTKLAGLISMPVLKALVKHIDPDRYNGATFVGLQGIVIKSHGGAGVLAFGKAIEEAILQVEKNVPSLISSEVECILKTLKDDSV